MSFFFKASARASDRDMEPAGDAAIPCDLYLYSSISLALLFLMIWSYSLWSE